MRIGIIGAGEIGGTLTRRLTALGHHVSVANSRGGGCPQGTLGGEQRAKNGTACCIEPARIKLLRGA